MGFPRHHRRCLSFPLPPGHGLDKFGPWRWAVESFMTRSATNHPPHATLCLGSPAGRAAADIQRRHARAALHTLVKLICQHAALGAVRPRYPPWAPCRRHVGTRPAGEHLPPRHPQYFWRRCPPSADMPRAVASDRTVLGTHTRVRTHTVTGRHHLPPTCRGPRTPSVQACRSGSPTGPPAADHTNHPSFVRASWGPTLGGEGLVQGDVH